jgi:hypothetical protein
MPANHNLLYSPDSIIALKTTHPILDATLPLPTFSPNILNLPPELILEIADHLPPDGIIALKLTHRILNGTLSLTTRLKNAALSTCARLAIRTYLLRPEPRPTHVRCILCKAVYPSALFSSSSSPVCLSLSFSTDAPCSEVIELPQRFCSWHVSRLTRIVRTESGGRNEWVSSLGRMCMHCGSVQEWSHCNCNCDTCSVRIVRTYTRYLNNSTECRRFLFYRDTTMHADCPDQDSIDGKLFVRETCYNPGMYTLHIVRST